MKNIILLLIGAFALTLSSCGTFAAYSEAGKQQFSDGIYGAAPSFKSKGAEDQRQGDDHQSCFFHLKRPPTID